eukprot:CAMPEP_0116568100 /NCGR_PEP_ID=MMETSP0397-20121206/15421_1 /TAXON_ID=216820 /ORGANISM="Cyclophora tenuis, Strain ECT3854" /LENGTH=315 /DNA_ID=CAMNT_0004095257 /DNA_START=1 /DNA_END=948 /DNA_ORIENTATION=-
MRSKDDVPFHDFDAADYNKTFFDRRAISFTHIPKCGGDSFTKEFNITMSRQNCYGDMPRNNWMTAVLVRSPRQHVHSQYGECRYDGYGIWRTANTSFARTDNLTADYEAFVKNFYQLKPWQFGESVCYRCMDPREIQTRYMSCHDAANPRANFALPYPPRLNVALVNLMDADFVGVTDFYATTACIFQYRREGTVPQGCECGSSQPKDHFHDRHGVPSNFSKYPTEHLNEMIDAFTRLDIIFFVAGMIRFLIDVEIAEKMAGCPLLCNREKAYELLETYMETEACKEYGCRRLRGMLDPLRRTASFMSMLDKKRI